MTLLILLGGSDGGFIVTGTPFEKLYVSSTDLSEHVLQYFAPVTVSSMTLRLGMWGEAMWGTRQILGSGFSNTYTSGQRHILQVTTTALNIKEIE